MDWKPDRPVSEHLARQVIEAQFPRLAPVQISAVAAGWDNVVYRINDEWFFRFPVREFAVPGVRKEIDCLPLLAAQVPSVTVPESRLGLPWSLCVTAILS